MTRVLTIPVAVRAVVLLTGAALAVLPGALHPVPLVVTAAGVVAAVVLPRTVGASIATIGFVIGWLAAAGWGVSLPVGRTVAAAAVFYVFLVSAALAAAVPLRARVQPAVLAAWLRKCAGPVAAAAVVVAVDETLPQRAGTPWIEFAGLLGVLLLGVAGWYAVRRRVAPRR
jgi:hypothetical protein